MPFRSDMLSQIGISYRIDTPSRSNTPFRSTMRQLPTRHFSPTLLPLLFGFLLLTAGCATLSGPAREPDADGAPAPPREFRAAWIATVANIDWPSEPGLSTLDQKEELRDLLDRAVELNLNAVILQVRPAGDALYESDLEPWSSFLTGKMGQAPEPYYDPLTFAVEEAHSRGLELHAWFNPYRVLHPAGDSVISADHVSRTRPDIVRRYGDYLWLDPGEPGAAEHTLAVILDVVDRYDIDGVHFDDYFYPYKAYAEGGDTEFPDSASWARAQADGVRLSRDDWRRQNVDRLIETLYRDIKKRKPHVKFGVSPFGIWRPGYPENVTGFDAYNELYADARKWLREGWVDYFTPQIYYRMSQHGQPYPIMLRWWIEQNVNARHIWPGNFTSRVAGRGDNRWPVEELLGQIYATRAQPGASGNVHFSMRVFMREDDELGRQLIEHAYSEPALIPAMPWLDDDPPGRPDAVLLSRDDGTRLVMTPANPDDLRLWLIRIRRGSEWTHEVLPRAQLSFRLDGPHPDAVLVTAVDRVGNLGPSVEAHFGDPAATGELADRLGLSIVPHSDWEEKPPLGHAADALRRNIPPGDSITFDDLSLKLLEMRPGEESDTARFELRRESVHETIDIAEGRAFAWNGYRVAVLAANTEEGVLGAGLAELEIAHQGSLPERLAESTFAGGAADRLRIPHEITRITLHHSGSPEPLRPEDDPVEKLRGLQSWGASARNWWDVPYHYLIDLDGTIYEGRDHRFMGETNTTYDPSGHFLISVIGNYNRQEPTPAQIDAITDLMTWAALTYDVPLSEIGGHSDWANTNCPGDHLQKYLDDGTFVNGVRSRISALIGSAR